MAFYFICINLLSIVSHMCICRCADLEEELANLKKKIHHLDDMLKCQQRKVRQMIEQVFMHTRRLTSNARCSLSLSLSIHTKTQSLWEQTASCPLVIMVTRPSPLGVVERH